MQLMKKSDNFDQKWGEALSSKGWIAVPVMLVTSQKKLNINSMEMNILLHLLMYWWDKDKHPYPSQISMAERIGVSVRTIQRHLETLSNKGLIIKISSPTINSFKTRNTYNLTPLVNKLNQIHIMKEIDK